MSAIDQILTTLADPDSARALLVADAVCKLVLIDREHGELPTRVVGGRACKILPIVWLERLHKAVSVGAFEKMTVEQIVKRIHTTQSEKA